MGIPNWVLRLLPDECEVSGCCGKGLRGSETKVYPFPHWTTFYIVMCKYCLEEYDHGRILRVDGLSDMIVSKNSKFVELSQYRRRRNAERTHQIRKRET
jgi:hypothetical protein